MQYCSIINTTLYLGIIQNIIYFYLSLWRFLYCSIWTIIRISLTILKNEFLEQMQFNHPDFFFDFFAFFLIEYLDLSLCELEY